MSVVDVRVGSAQGELQRPWESRTGSWSARESITVELHGEEGRVGRGEASPLPGFSVEDHERARAELGALDWERAYEMRRAAVLESGWDHSGGGSDEGLCPSVRFASELAIEELLAQSLSEPHPLFSASRRPPLLTAPVIPVNDRAWFAAAAEQAIRDGARTVKLKVGRNWDLEEWAIRHLRETFGSSIRIRLDANGALGDSLIEAHQRLHAAARFGVELIEEPCALDALAELCSPVPVAIDESILGLKRERWHELLARPEVSYLVLKPMLLGGLWEVCDFAARARAAGRGVIISHLLDGPVAYEAYARIAMYVGGAAAMGLAAHPGLLALGEGPPAWAAGHTLAPPPPDWVACA